MNFEEKKISSKSVFSGHIIDVEVATVELPDGRTTTREIVKHVPAVAVLALTADHQMILMKQWRAPIDALTLEVPAGKLDQRDEGNALEAVERELNEETRLSATKITELSSFYTSVGFSDEYMTLYLATGLHPVADELPQDEDENLELMTVDLATAKAMIADQRIVDAKTVMAIYYWETQVLSGELNG